MENIIKDKQKIDELLSRGVDEIIIRKDLEEKLMSDKQLRVKLGIDPTSPNLHLGRSIPLLKLRDFQNLGHQIVFIIGDFTGVIGDTSDKDSERPMLDRDVVKINMEKYVEQAGKILDIDKCEVKYNSEWLEKLNYQDISAQANVFSVNEFISRDNIKRRLDEGKRVSMREVLYPLMQGWDSVEIRADVEVGGTDQRFNLLAGRTLQKENGQEPQNIITNPLIEGLDGRKMSSSWGNTINLVDTENDMYGKTMSLKDEFIIKYFVHVTRVEMSVIKEYEKQIADGVNPRDIKMKLAFEITAMYHGEESAKKAEENFVNTIQKKEIPDEITNYKLPTRLLRQAQHKQAQGGQITNLVEILVETKLVKSKGEARRLIEQGGVKVDGEVVKDINTEIKISDQGTIIQKGKLKFIKLIN